MLREPAKRPLDRSDLIVTTLKIVTAQRLRAGKVWVPKKTRFGNGSIFGFIGFLDGYLYRLEL